MLMKAITGGGSWSTITGNPVTFSALSAPLKQLEVAFSPVQDLHGYDAPWPAGGGKNLSPTETVSLTTNTTTFIEVDGDGTESRNLVLSFQLNNASYASGSGALLGFYNGSTWTYFTPGQAKRVSDNVALNALPLPVSGRFYVVYSGVLPANHLSIYYESDSFGKWTGDDITDIMVEIGTTPTSYAPYSNICPISGWSSLTVYHSGADTSDPRSISISIGQTVYSGYVDVVTGVGEINWVKDVYDGSGDETWGYTISENPAAFYTQISHPMDSPQSMGNYLKRVTTFGAVSGFSYLIHSNQIRLSDMGGECADTTQAGAIAKLRAYLAANPFEVVHEIPTPITIQLTPQEVESLAGDNTMWSNANQPITVEYRKN